MAIESLQRKYNLTDAELCLFTSNLCEILERDLDDLAAFNLNEQKIDDLKDLGDSFEVFPSDEVLLAYITGATEAKNAKLAQVKEGIRNMVTRCQMKWGANSWQEKSLTVSGFNNFSDAAIFTASRRVAIQMNEFLYDLEDTGLTQDMIEDFVNLSQEYEDALNYLSNKITNRDRKTEERIMKGNELYALVTTYCEIGKRVYAMTDHAKYNDYLIYGTGSGGSSGGGGTPQIAAPTNFRYDFAERTVKWNSVSGATSYKLEISDDNTVWDVMYEGENTEFFTGEMLPEHKYLRVRSRNYQGMSVPALYNVVYNYTLNGPTNLTHNPALPGFTWDPVTNATAYEVQLRLASGTDDDYNLIYFGNDTTLIHGDPNGSYYVRIRSVSATSLSGWMLLAYVVGV